jgi:hypothetical protein
MSGLDRDWTQNAGPPARGGGRPSAASPLNYFAPVPEPLRTPLAKVATAPVDPEPRGEVPPDLESDQPKPCAFESFVNVVGTLLVVATVLVLLIDRVHPIFLAKP